jgi:hypothetical protein
MDEDVERLYSIEGQPPVRLQSASQSSSRGAAA